MRWIGLAVVIGCGTTPAPKSEPVRTNAVSEPIAPAAVAEDASDVIEAAFRDHRRRYGEPAQFDRQQPMPIDDIGTR